MTGKDRGSLAMLEKIPFFQEVDLVLLQPPQGYILSLTDRRVYPSDSLTQLTLHPEIE